MTLTVPLGDTAGSWKTELLIVNYNYYQEYIILPKSPTVTMFC